MSAYNDKRRDLKRPYRKKALQSGMSQIAATVQSHPLPQHTYSTSTHQETAPFRKGIDARTYDRNVRPAVESLEKANVIDSARYPWHLVLKADSGNVIGRTKWNWASGANGNLSDGSYVDILTINVADVAGTSATYTAGGTSTGGKAKGDRGPSPLSPPQTKGQATGTETPSTGNPRFPGTGAGMGQVGVSGTVRVASPGEYYKIASFGHSTISTSNFSTSTSVLTAANPIVYQIWVDGSLFMEWSNFQWASVTPKVDQWHFDQPIGVARQIVFRVVNQTGQTIDQGSSSGTVGPDLEVCFTGWAENVSSVTDIGHTQLENVA